MENEWVKLDTAQKISIAEFRQKNKEPVIQLEDAGVEIGNYQTGKWEVGTGRKAGRSDPRNRAAFLVVEEIALKYEYSNC